ncbi:MAG: hypothetical protein ACYDA2_06775 [Acidimicrobiales bacterium]
MAFEMRLTRRAIEDLDGITDPKRRAKVIRCLDRLSQDPRHPGLSSHRYEVFDEVYVEKVWESYVENRTPSAWRVWWHYGPDSGQITVLTVRAHP